MHDSGGRLIVRHHDVTQIQLRCILRERHNDDAEDNRNDEEIKLVPLRDRAAYDGVTVGLSTWSVRHEKTGTSLKNNIP